MDEQLVREAHLHLDRLDAETFASLFAEGGQLRLGNAPPAIGRCAGAALRQRAFGVRPGAFVPRRAVVRGARVMPS